MSDSIYLRLHGLEITKDGLTRIVSRDGVSPSGGGRKTDEASAPGLQFATITDEGCNPVKYAFTVVSPDRSVIERIAREANNCPVGAEFNPYNSERLVFVQSAHAAPLKPKRFLEGGQAVNWPSCEVQVVCRNALAYGAPQGIPFSYDVDLPVSTNLQNDGNYPAGLDYLFMSGDYDPVEERYTSEVQLSVGANQVMLCNRMMRDDKFKLVGLGNILHSYETTFTKTYSQQQADLGTGCLDYGSGGSYALHELFLGNDAKILIPFYGPLPIKERPYLEIEWDSLIGTPRVVYAFSQDLSDVTELPVTMVRGLNKVYVPRCEGEDFVALGVKTDGSSAGTLSRVYAEVQRYISEDDIPVVEESDEAVLTISCGEHSYQKLSRLQCIFRSMF